MRPFTVQLGAVGPGLKSRLGNVASQHSGESSRIALRSEFTALTVLKNDPGNFKATSDVPSPQTSPAHDRLPPGSRTSGRAAPGSSRRGIGKPRDL